jgi:ERCC4-type nuclease
MSEAFPIIPDLPPSRTFRRKGAESKADRIAKKAATKPAKKKGNPSAEGIIPPVGSTEPVAEPVAKSLQEGKGRRRVEIWVDERERSIKDALASLGGSIPVVSKVMPIGDMAFVEAGDSGQDAKMVQLYERKSIADLLASIMDGRYKEQSYRMLGSVDLPAHNMVYVLEGDLGGLGAAEKQRFYSAMTSIQFFKGMSVLRTASVEETAELLLRMAEKVEREWNEKRSEAALQVGREYVQHGAALIKRQNVSRENIGEIMLCCIPGVSAVYAKAVLARFGGSFQELVRNVRPEGVDTGEIDEGRSDSEVVKLDSGEERRNLDEGRSDSEVMKLDSGVQRSNLWKDIRGSNGRRIPANLVSRIQEMLA